MLGVALLGISYEGICIVVLPSREHTVLDEVSRSFFFFFLSLLFFILGFAKSPGRGQLLHTSLFQASPSSHPANRLLTLTLISATS